MRDIRKSVIPKFINIVESCHVGVPLRVTNMAPGNQQNASVVEFSFKYVDSSLGCKGVTVPLDVDTMYPIGNFVITQVEVIAD